MRKKFVTTTLITLILFTLCLICFSACNDKKPSTVEITDILLNKYDLSLEQGEVETLVITILPDNATDKTVNWTSSDETVATVDNGKITAIAAGTAMVTAKAGDKTAICSVNVTEPVISMEGKTLICTVFDIEVTDSSKFDSEETIQMMLSPDNPYRKIYLNSRFVFKENNELTIFYGEYGAITSGQDHIDATYTQTGNTITMTIGDLEGTLIVSANTSKLRLINNGYDLLFDLNFVTD